MISKLDSSWKDALKSEINKPYFKVLNEKINTLYTDPGVKIFPKYSEIFFAMDSCPLHDVKVVILGQDPYPTEGVAHGLCFSIDENKTTFPKSLQNIFKEIKNDIGKEIPLHGSLTSWAKQGVLLLNSVLTVGKGNPESHFNLGWEEFTDAVIDCVNDQAHSCVFLLWGSKAQKKAEKINTTKHLVLKSAHPSPLSAYRGFFGCKHFSQTNTFLISKGLSPIEW